MPPTSDAGKVPAHIQERIDAGKAKLEAAGLELRPDEFMDPETMRPVKREDALDHAEALWGRAGGFDPTVLSREGRERAEYVRDQYKKKGG